MAIRIGEDGTIINGDEVISNSGTIIRDDGTIESSNIGAGQAPQQRYVNLEAPVSPFENGGVATRTTTNPEPVQSTPISEPRGANPHTKSIADLEYDLMVAEGHVKGATNMTPLIIGVISIILGLLLHPILLIGVVIAGGMFYTQYTKKSNYEAEAQRIRNEISKLKQR